MINIMNSGELAKDVPGAEIMLQLHHERKVRYALLYSHAICNTNVQKLLLLSSRIVSGINSIIFLPLGI
jgi:hypothetical protein